MIYHIYFQTVGPEMFMYKYIMDHAGKRFDALAMQGCRLDYESYLGHKIHDSVDDTFIFITTESGQRLKFEQFVKDYELKDLIVEEQLITNHNYPEQAKNLRLTIMQSKDHFQRKEKKDGG